MFQPIVQIGKPEKAVFGYEALSRGPADTPFEDPTSMFLSAYDQGNLAEIDMMCLRNAIKNSKYIPPGKKVFVNIHPYSLGKSMSTSEEILDIMKSMSMQPGQFVIELVEQFPVRNHDMFIGNVIMLRKGGALIGLDDVGAGYSDFFLLSKIKPDLLKVNGYFADHITMNTIKQKVVRAVVDLSKDINARVIVEGIERQEDLRTIEDLGVHMGQGYLFAKPVVFKDLKF